MSNHVSAVRRLAILTQTFTSSATLQPHRPYSVDHSNKHAPKHSHDRSHKHPHRHHKQPHEAYRKLHDRFVALKGHHGIDHLVDQSVNQNPVICIGGDQSTGKSTLATRLAAKYEGSVQSAGRSFRDLAKSLGVTPAALSNQAINDPSIDVSIDWSICSMIATGSTTLNRDHDTNNQSNNQTNNLPIDQSNNQHIGAPLFIEGRQPAVMARYVQSITDSDDHSNNQSTNQSIKQSDIHKPIYTIFLRCSIREQALRFISRELGSAAAESAAKILPHDARSLSELTPYLSQLDFDGKQKIIETFQDNDRRDEFDRKRYNSLYGTHELMDYRVRNYSRY